MRKRNVLTALAAAALVLQVAVVTAGPSMAQTTPTPAVEFGFTPTTGLAGTKITFTGTGCPHDATKTLDGLVFLTQGNDSQINPTPFTSDAEGKFTAQLDTTGLAPGQYTTVAVCATTNKGGPGSPFTVNAPVIQGSTYFPLSPGRVLDTRNGTGTGGVIEKLGAADSLDVTVTGLLGVPATGVTAVALNVVATDAIGPPSFLTV